MKRLSFEKRLDLCEIPLLQKLFKIIIEKRTNLCVAANIDGDIATFEKLIDAIGPHICVLKTQLRPYLLDYPARKFIELLKTKKKEYNFLIFDDEKYNDSPDTNKRVYKGYPVYYADFVSVDDCGDVAYKFIAEAVQEAELEEGEFRGCLKLCEKSFKKVSTKPQECYDEFQRNKPICVGIIAQDFEYPTDQQDSCVKFTPGVRIGLATDGAQNWRDPKTVIEKGADVVIVGRGVTEGNWGENAIRYKEIAYKAYCENVDS